MSGYNPYQAPQAPSYQPHAPAPAPGQEVPGTIVESMRGSRGWIMFLGILTVIGAGFLVLAGLGVAVAADEFGLPAFVGVVYLFMAAIYVLPAVFMLRFAGAIKQLTETRSMDSLDEACARSRDFWRLVGIMALVVMVLYFLAIFAAIAMGVAGEMFDPSVGYRVQCTVGRLVEIAIWSPVSVEEAIVWGREHNEVVDSVGGAYVCFVDLRGAHVFPADVVEAYVSTMTGEERLERTATLLPTSAMVALQIGRMIREAGHPGRQAFDSKDRLRAFLEPALSPEERHRLGRLLQQADFRRGV